MNSRLIVLLFKFLWHALRKDRYIVKIKFSTTKDIGYASYVDFKDDTHLNYEITTWNFEAMEMDYGLAMFLKAAIMNNAIRDKSMHITYVTIEKVGQ